MGVAVVQQRHKINENQLKHPGLTHQPGQGGKDQCLYSDRLVLIPDVNKNDVIQGQAIQAKMTSPGGKLTALARHSAKKVNKAE
jgi:hypothetical protein